MAVVCYVFNIFRSQLSLLEKESNIYLKLGNGPLQPLTVGGTSGKRSIHIHRQKFNYLNNIQILNHNLTAC